MTTQQPNDGNVSNKLLHPKVKANAVIVSDWHLGSPASCVKDITQFLDHIDTKTIYLLGDVLDCWSIGHANISKFIKDNPGQSCVIKKLEKMAQDGVKIVYTPGNHDNHFRKRKPLPFLSRFMQPVELVHETEDGRKILLTHGDKLDKGIFRTDTFEAIGTTIYESFVKMSAYATAKLHDESSLAFRLFGAHKDFSLLQTVQNFYRQLPYKDDFKNRAIQYIVEKNAEISDWNAKHPNAPLKLFDGIWCGHTHFATKDRIKIGERILSYANAGSWIGPPGNEFKNDDERFIESQRWVPYNTAILERSGKAELVQWIPTKGITRLGVGQGEPQADEPEHPPSAPREKAAFGKNAL